MYWMNKLGEACLVRTEKPNRENNYCTLSGLSFVDRKPVPQSRFTTAKEQEVKEKTLQEQYAEVFGKQPPARYKNDTEWLNTKINETLTPM